MDILESLAGHLPVSLLRMRGLLLRHCSQDGLPDVVEEGRKVERESGQGEGQRREELRREGLCVKRRPARGG